MEHPAAIDATARQAGLGSHRSGYALAAKSTPLGGKFAIWVAAVLGFVAMWVANPPDNSVTQYAMLILMLTVFGLGGSLLRSRYQRSFKSATRLDLFDAGLVYTTKDEAHVARYRDTAMRQDITQRPGLAVVYRYTFRDTEGADFTVTELVENPEEWGRVVGDRILAAQFPSAWTALESGARLTFGPLSISAEQLSCGGDTWAWADISASRINDGALYLQTRGDWIGQRLARLRDIPNYPVPLAIIDRLRGSR